MFVGGQAAWHGDFCMCVGAAKKKVVKTGVEKAQGTSKRISGLEQLAAILDALTPLCHSVRVCTRKDWNEHSCVDKKTFCSLLNI